MASLPTAPEPLLLPKFALFCFQRKLKLDDLAKALDCSRETARRLQFEFGHPRRCIPKADLANRIHLYTGGECPPGSFYPTPQQAALLARRATAA